MIGGRDWQDRAVCAGHGDPDLWFPDGEGAKAQRQAERAKRLCVGCPVRPQCLAGALADLPADGVWAGYTVAELRAQVRGAAA